MFFFILIISINSIGVTEGLAGGYDGENGPKRREMRRLGHSVSIFNHRVTICDISGIWSSPLESSESSGFQRNMWGSVKYCMNLESRQPVRLRLHRNLAKKPDRTGLLNTNEEAVC